MAEREGTGRPSPSVWPSPSEDENPKAPPDSDSSTNAAMAGDLLLRGCLAGGVRAHHGPAYRRVPDQESGIDGQAHIDPVQVLSKRGPVPGS